MSTILKKRSSRRGRDDDSVSVTSKTRRSRSRSPLRQASEKGKTIIGMITGESRKKKKEEKAKKLQKEATLKSVNENRLSPAIRASNTEPDMEDEETVYGVELDNGLDNKLISIKTPVKKTDSSVTSELGVTIDVILLLLDSGSRRFELLQLEFDSSKAVVQDIISQIPFSATEETLRNQAYSEICVPGGLVMDSNEIISKYCKGSEVLIAVPAGINAEECQKLSKPILSDPNITKLLSNLNASGFEEAKTDAVEEKKPSVEVDEGTKDTLSEADKENTDASDSSAVAAPKSGSSLSLLIVFIAIMVPIIWKYQDVVTSPLSPGDIISPGEKRSKCGILSLLPESTSECTPSYIEMGRDGVLTIFNEEEGVMTLTGGECENSEDDCILGTLVTETGQLLIGGMTPKLGGNKKHDLSPWPFTESIYSKRGKL